VSSTSAVSPIEVRPFHRRDRDQLTSLVNAHAAAVVPGMDVSVATVLSQLEREPAEFIVDPWVQERMTLVAVERNRVAAAAHLLRYVSDDRVSTSYRGTGEIRWLLFWPQGPASPNAYWTDATRAAEQLIAACVRQSREWGVASLVAGGELPAPGVYGVPEQWPHIRALYERAGFRHVGHTEVVYLIKVDDISTPADPPLAGLRAQRSVGLNGTRLSAVTSSAVTSSAVTGSAAATVAEVAGYIEVEIFAEGERSPRHSRWADIGNLHVEARYRRRGVATWLLGQAAEWLRLAQVDRLLDYAWLSGTDSSGQSYDEYRAFLAASGFRELTRSARDWRRDP
jgi:GNAT superfamily N-acetyltransferase